MSTASIVSSGDSSACILSLVEDGRGAMWGPSESHSPVESGPSRKRREPVRQIGTGSLVFFLLRRAAASERGS